MPQTPENASVFALPPLAPDEDGGADEQYRDRRQEHRNRANGAPDATNLRLHRLPACLNLGVLLLIDRRLEHAQSPLLGFLKVAGHDLLGLRVEVAAGLDFLSPALQPAPRVVQ